MNAFIDFLQSNIILTVAWVILFILLMYSFINPILAKYKRINNHEMTLLINKKDATVLDIRPQKDFKNGHIQGARQIKPEQVREGDFSRLEKEKEKPIIVVCAMGNLASGTAAKMTKQGFSDVYVLDGGMNGWTSASLPVTK